MAATWSECAALTSICFAPAFARPPQCMQDGRKTKKSRLDLLLRWLMMHSVVLTCGVEACLKSKELFFGNLWDKIDLLLEWQDGSTACLRRIAKLAKSRNLQMRWLCHSSSHPMPETLKWCISWAWVQSEAYLMKSGSALKEPISCSSLLWVRSAGRVHTFNPAWPSSCAFLYNLS